MSSPEGWAERWVLARATNGTCGHFTEQPEPMYVFAWDPRRLYLCAECAQSSQERLRGTEQAFDCDRCHQIEGGGTANLVGLDGGRAPLYVGWALCKSLRSRGAR
jgi:hypothetical protein